MVHEQFAPMLSSLVDWCRTFISRFSFQLDVKNRNDSFMVYNVTDASVENIQIKG